MPTIDFSLSWNNILLGIVAYVVIIRLLRYRIRDAMLNDYSYYLVANGHRKMTVDHAYQIQKTVFSQEFPFTAEKALQFALFRTYGIPSISKLLLTTKQLTSRESAPKRYSDTTVLIEEFIGNPPSHPRTLDAIARMNYIHNRYQTKGLISNDDMLYTLSLFALEPARWINKYEWRDLSPLEMLAIAVFWKAQGDAMQINMSPLREYAATEASDPFEGGTAWFQALVRWSEVYERKYMVPDVNNKKIADETTAILLWDLPQDLHLIGRYAVSSLMDERLRAAMMYETPPVLISEAVQTVLAIRKWVIRYFFPPRPIALRVKNIQDKPNRDGRLNLNYYTAEPWYVTDSFWKRNSFGSWIKWLNNQPLPSRKYQPEGYLIPEVGPRALMGKGQKEQARGVKRLRAMKRGGCPFA